jgi:hypothetical protein
MQATDKVGQMIPQMYPNQVMQLQKIPNNTVNAYNKTTTVTNYVFNTAFRDDYFFSNSNNCSFTLPLKLKNVMTVNLAAIQFPNVTNTFSDAKGTNSIYIAEETTQKQGLVAIPNGNYTAEEFVAILQTAINVTLGTAARFTVVLDPYTSRIRISNTTYKFYMNLLQKLTSSFTWSYDAADLMDLKKANETVLISYLSSMGYLMGFNQVEYNGKKTYQSESIFNDTFQDYVYIELNDYTGNQFEGTVGILPHAMLNKNILSVMPVTSAKLSTTFDNNANFIQKMRTYSAPVNISKITVKISGPVGEPYDLKNCDFMFVLQVTTVFDNVTPYIG